MTVYVYCGEGNDSNSKYEYSPRYLPYFRTIFKYFDRNTEAIRFAAASKHFNPEFLGYWKDQYGKLHEYTQEEADFLKELYRRATQGEDYNVLGDEWSECLKRKAAKAALHVKSIS